MCAESRLELDGSSASLPKSLHVCVMFVLCKGRCLAGGFEAGKETLLQAVWMYKSCLICIQFQPICSYLGRSYRCPPPVKNANGSALISKIYCLVRWILRRF